MSFKNEIGLKSSAIKIRIIGAETRIFAFSNKVRRVYFLPRRCIGFVIKSVDKTVAKYICPFERKDIINGIISHSGN